jgi:hypothetical protein
MVAAERRFKIEIRVLAEQRLNALEGKPSGTKIPRHARKPPSDVIHVEHFSWRFQLVDRSRLACAVGTTNDRQKWH